MGFPGGSDGKESGCNEGDLGSVPGLGRSPGKENGNPLQDSCLENSMDRGAWWVYRVHRVAKSRPPLNDSLKHTLYIYKLDGQNQALHQVTVDPRVAGHQSQLLWAGRTLWRCRAWGMAGSSTPCWVRRIHGTYQSSACLRLSSHWAHPCTRKRYPCSAAYEGLVHTPATSCCPPHTPAFLCASL